MAEKKVDRGVQGVISKIKKLLLRFDLGLDLVHPLDNVLDLRLHPHDSFLTLARLIRHRRHLPIQRIDRGNPEDWCYGDSVAFWPFYFSL